MSFYYTSETNNLLQSEILTDSFWSLPSVISCYISFLDVSREIEELERLLEQLSDWCSSSKRNSTNHKRNITIMQHVTLSVNVFLVLHCFFVFCFFSLKCFLCCYTYYFCTFVWWKMYFKLFIFIKFLNLGFYSVAWYTNCIMLYCFYCFIERHGNYILNI